jgi:hypothetical protein
MTTSAAGTRHTETSGLRVVGSIAAILAAGGVLALGVSATDRSTSGNADITVEPGKISVVGNAKVRKWDGQTFSMEVPLKWARTYSGKATDEAGGPPFQFHAWTRPAPGADGKDARLRGNPDWSVARPAADARITLEIRPATSSGSSRTRATTLARQLSADPGYRFGDLGPVTIGGEGASSGRYAWRLNMATAGDLESHYFFTTCEADRRREAWHVTFDRRSVREQQPVLQAMLASLDTVYAPSRPSATNQECVS